MNKFWTTTDIEFITTNYPLRGIKYCAQQLNRSENSIAKKALRLGLRAPSQKKTTESYIQELCDKDIDIFPEEDYKGAHINITHSCLKGHSFPSRPSNILSGSGCPYCSNRVARTTEEYTALIKFRVLEEYIDTRTPILHECDNGHTWKAAPSNIIRGSGCPSCAKYGIDLNKPTTLYYAKIYKENKVYFKIGITNNEPLSRLRGNNIKLLYDHEFFDGIEAKEIERSILQEFAEYRLKDAEVLSSGGNTELFGFDILGFDT